MALFLANSRSGDGVLAGSREVVLMVQAGFGMVCSMI